MTMQMHAIAWPEGYLPGTTENFVSNEAIVAGVRFRFRTVGFPVEAEVTECVAPAARLDVHHAWPVEDLDGDRVRILTQETQKGRPAVELAAARPDPMLNGHQAWLDGLIGAARAGG